ncbi:MAG: GNAT family N-acetyltransferase [Acidobacteriota bacterium]
MKLALDGKTRITTTPLVDVELPEVGDFSAPRAPIRERLESLPQEPISKERLEERDSLAGQFMKILWPKSQKGSRTFRHNMLDCKHLASHRLCGGNVFVTLDEGLLTKARVHAADLEITVVHPSEVAALFRQSEAAAREGDHLPLSVVRRARPDDGQAIGRLLEPIKSSYPQFDRWWAAAQGQKEVYVGIIDGEIGGIAVWARKDDRVVKLSSFYVREDLQGRGLGPHLLFTQIRLWVEKRFEKVYVTLSSERLSILPFFLEYGFRIEGVSSRRYGSGTSEFVVSKHLYYDRVTDDGLEGFLVNLSANVFRPPNDQHITDNRRWFAPPVRGSLVMEQGSAGALPRISVERDGAPSEHLTLNELEELIYPARIALRDRKAFLVPIRPHWADRMMAIPRSQGQLFDDDDKLRLRTDNAYYCYPRHTPEALTGAPVLFYVSAPDRKIAGFARVLECDIAPPEELFEKYGGIGIYGQENVEEHKKESDGTAMALRFGWWVPFPTPVALSTLRKRKVAYPQTVTAISYEIYEALLAEGGIEW